MIPSSTVSRLAAQYSIGKFVHMYNKLSTTIVINVSYSLQSAIILIST